MGGIIDERLVEGESDVALDFYDDDSGHEEDEKDLGRSNLDFVSSIIQNHTTRRTTQQYRNSPPAKKEIFCIVNTV